ncbi:MAG: valine--tRNA ligase [Candidatus Nealsonbacteria bacterium DGGOD1a]|jgi:valyl-tRNA synthetase|nr:MAG: valine--tRNA ligase [Candidatus Nealsonbacteria bacterium DGGOD1a]
MEPLSTHYNPKESEKKHYENWERKGYFNPDKFKARSKKVFSVVLPPPNVTGTLHMGHALNITIQDAMVRYHRMKGDATVWIPGTDHASIGLQSTLEKRLRKEGVSRFDLGREKFIEKAWEWREQYGNIILNQIRAMGASCDWSRLKFTMDPDYVDAVEAAFIHYYQQGWVYRGERVVNWCPRCGTSISDLEVDFGEESSKLWYLKYPIADSGGGFITVATTRPETMLGDTAVAVNPKDKRFKSLAGKFAVLPIVNRKIPIIADNAIEIGFGTGAVKVTPAHDSSDWQIGQRHKLPMISVIDERGKINQNGPESYRGLKAAEAREKIVAELSSLGLVEKIEDYTHQVPKCSRCGAGIQLIPSKQWFLKMDELANKALKAGKSGKVKFHPKRWQNTYYSWLTEPRDWCLSRQLWWGQRMPVWFCQNRPEEYFAAKTAPKVCPICKNCQPKRSEDVFDTWFSSALWPMAVFGWPKATKDFKKFFPTSVLTTGRDIISIWVSRMVFSALEFTKKSPFANVMINAMVLTKDGRRMSKSLGTGIDPMMLIEKYGTDATRFGLAWQVTESQDMHFNEDNMVSGGKFCNKIWNAAKFILYQLGDGKRLYSASVKPPAVSKADRRILAGLKKIALSTEKRINKYEFGHAIRELYEFFWHEFCDIYIEAAKIQINRPKNKLAAEQTKSILIFTLANLLKLMHPFMPFITEEVYRFLPVKNKKDMIVESWPEMK